MFSLIVFGAICLLRLGVSQMPDIDFPIVNISVAYDGAAPEVIEADVIEPMENRLLSIEGIKEMKSSVTQGSGNIRLTFDINRNVDVALQEAQSALSRFRLPPGVDPPLISKVNPEEEPIMFISIYGDRPLMELLDWTDKFLLDQLRFIDGVGEVSIAGFSQRNLRIWIDIEKLEKAYLTIQDVVEAFSREHVESAAGQFSEGKRELRLRWLGEAASLEQVENLPILRRGGSRIIDRQYRIKDVAKVEDGLSDIRRVARIAGQEAVAISVRKQRGTNEVKVAEAVQARMSEMQQRFPEGMKYRVNIDFTRSAKATIELTWEKLILSGLVTILVCFLFLGNIQSALNILFSIPTSIVGTGIILYFSGFTLNLFSLLALTLAISIVVDDAIMLLENIVRHYRMGKSPHQAAFDGSMEVLPAATAATLAVLAVFIPVVFMDGIIGRFFFQFGVTMSAAVLLSLLEAVTITPMRSAAFLKEGAKTNRFEDYLENLFHRWSHRYQGLLKAALKWKWAVLIGTTVIFILSLVMVTRVRKEFVPAQDQDVIMVIAQAPTGSSLQFTADAARQIEDFLRKQPEVAGFVLSIGAGGPNSAVNQIFSPVALKPLAERKVGHLALMQKWREEFKKFKDLRVTMRDISSRNLTTGRLNPISLNVLGPDLQVLKKKTDDLLSHLESKKLGVDMDTDFRLGLPELLLQPKREAMAERGVSTQDVGLLLAAGVGGFIQGRYTVDGKRYDIRFKVLDSQIKTKEDLKHIYVRNVSGNLIPLSELVDVKEQGALQSISRINRQRAIAVFGNLAPGQSQSTVLNEIQSFLNKELPAGYTFSFDGASAGFGEAFQSLTGALLIGLLTAYLILAVQFNSFVHPISVLMALPFSISGAFLALWMWGVSLNLFSFIGLVVLMGIAKKNSIMLVEFTNQLRERDPNQGVTKALLEACPVRLRPILMTSVATMAAALPLIVGGGFGSETRIPMGLTILGGTLVSTLLTLFVTPCWYSVLSFFESAPKDRAVR